MLLVCGYPKGLLKFLYKTPILLYRLGSQPASESACHSANLTRGAICPRQAALLSAAITPADDLVVGLAALDTLTNTVTLSTGEAFEMPTQAETAQLVIAGVQASFQPQPPMVVEAVALAPERPLIGEGIPGDRLRWLGAVYCCAAAA